MPRSVLSLVVMFAALALTPAKAQDTNQPGAADAPGVAIFAGGCFWCVESDFDHIKGVKETVSGYIGGRLDNPTYESHTSNGDREAVQITYDPAMVSYEQLLKVFFRTVDPTDDGGQFCDRGHSYTTAVYTLNGDQAQLAEAARQDAAKALERTIVTEIVEAPTFWPAEDYHQNFHAKNPIRYNYYRRGCGRDKRIEALWGDEAHYGLGKS